MFCLNAALGAWRWQLAWPRAQHGKRELLGFSCHAIFFLSFGFQPSYNHQPSVPCEAVHTVFIETMGRPPVWRRTQRPAVAAERAEQLRKAIKNISDAILLFRQAVAPPACA